MKISGTERALVGENILIHISLLKNSISNILISLSSSLKLIKSFNYNLDRRNYSKNVISFEVSKFNFENNLTLGFKSEKLNSEEYQASIEIKALDIEENVKEMSIFDIEILKPEIHIEITHGNKPEDLNIKLEKKINEVTTFFKDLNVSAKDYITKKNVKVEIIRFSEEEYIDKMDDIPILFDIDSAIKKIIIHSNSTIELNIKACYHDLFDNNYESNEATIILQPIVEKTKEEEFITTPIFNTIGFETPGIAMASS
ncbi:hypothetical protein LCGC14_2133890 [marine sediment metagenome]|uniref:Uncharacterized protein n=1 Tax=marine sediment metagenome TaxID=412755 RepID=A0A0F9GWM6_9ZZZZ|nr:hypothetical protein [bacterium]